LGRPQKKKKKNWLEFLSFNGVRVRLFIVDLDNTIEAAVFSLHQSLAGSRNRVGLLWLGIGSKLPPPYCHTSRLRPLVPFNLIALLTTTTTTTTTAAELRLLICKAILRTGQPRPTSPSKHLDKQGTGYNSFN